MVIYPSIFEFGKYLYIRKFLGRSVHVIPHRFVSKHVEFYASNYVKMSLQRSTYNHVEFYASDYVDIFPRRSTPNHVEFYASDYIDFHIQPCGYRKTVESQ